MNLLLINAYEIITISLVVLMLYILAIKVLIQTKANLLQYLLLFLVPIVGAAGIVLVNLDYLVKNKAV